MFRSFLLFCIAVFVLEAAPSFEQMKRENRIALVIVNGGYQGAPLPKAYNNGAQMTEFLERSGFKVFYHEDIDKREFIKALRDFTSAIKPDSVSLLYFYGHATSQMRKNYLVPVDHAIDEEQHIRYEAIALDPLIKKIAKKQNRLNFVILDTAYEHPFGDTYKTETPGLAGIRPIKGFNLFLSLRPGMTAKAQNFSERFIKTYNNRGLSVAEGVDAIQNSAPKNQPPMILTDDEQPFFFRLPNSLSSKAEKAWHWTQNEGTMDAYELFIRIYPQSRHVSAARLHLQRLASIQ